MAELNACALFSTALYRSLQRMTDITEDDKYLADTIIRYMQLKVIISTLMTGSGTPIARFILCSF